MSTSDDDLAERRFLVQVKGYDRDEVEAFRAEAVARIGVLEQQLAEQHDAPPQSSSELFAEIGQHTARVLEAAQEAGDELRRQAREQVEAEERSAAAEAARVRREAQSEADAIRAATIEEREQLEDELADRRAEVESDIAELVMTRDRLVEALLTAQDVIADGLDIVAQPAAPQEDPESSWEDEDSEPTWDEGELEPSREEGDPESAWAAENLDVTATQETTQDLGPELDQREDEPDAWSVDEPPSPDGETEAEVGEPTLDEDEDEEEDEDEYEYEDETEAFELDAILDATGEGAGDGSLPLDDPLDPAEPIQPEPRQSDGSEELGEPEELGNADELEESGAGAPLGRADERPSERARTMRTRALAPLHPQMMRVLKRGLTELQTVTAARVRQADDLGAVEDLLPTPTEMTSLGELGGSFLMQAFDAGAAAASTLSGRSLGGPTAHPRLVDAFADEAASRVTGPLHLDLEAGIAEREPARALAGRVDTVFDLAKRAGMDDIAAAHLIDAYERGLDETLEAGDLTREDVGIESDTQRGHRGGSGT